MASWELGSQPEGTGVSLPSSAAAAKGFRKDFMFSG